MPEPQSGGPVEEALAQFWLPLPSHEPGQAELQAGLPLGAGNFPPWSGSRTGCSESSVQEVVWMATNKQTQPSIAPQEEPQHGAELPQL